MLDEYTVYDPMTGVILRFGYCPQEDWERQAGPGEVMWHVREALRDDEWMIVAGEKVPLGG